MKSKLWLMGLILAGSIFCQDVSAWTWDNFTSELRSRNVYPKSGNIGIGSSSPRAKLDVEGAAYIDGDLTLTGSISNNSTSGVGIITDKAVYIAGNVGIGTATSAQKLHVEGAVYFGAGNVGINTVSPLAQLSVKNNNTTPLMVSKTGSGDLLIVTSAGNVGIGTTSPKQLLEVDGNVYLGGRGEITTTGATSTGSSKIYLGRRSATAGDSSIIYVQTRTGITFAQLDTINLAAFFNGNVGIGTSASPSCLTVGSAPSLTYVNGVNDAYVKDGLEVDGSAYLGDGSTDKTFVDGAIYAKSKYQYFKTGSTCYRVDLSTMTSATVSCSTLGL